MSPGTQHQGRRYLRRTRHAVRAKRGGARCPKGTIENSRSRLRGSIWGEARNCPKHVLWHLPGGPQKMCRKMSPGTPGGHRNMLKMSLHIFFRALRNFFGLSYLLKGGSSPWGSSKGQKNCAKQKKNVQGGLHISVTSRGPWGHLSAHFLGPPKEVPEQMFWTYLGFPPIDPFKRLREFSRELDRKNIIIIAPGQRRCGMEQWQLIVPPIVPSAAPPSAARSNSFFRFRRLQRSRLWRTRLWHRSRQGIPKAARSPGRKY